MNINAVWQKLQDAVAECEAGATQSFQQYHRLKGISDGYKLAMRILAENGIVPEMPTEPDSPDVIPFKPRED